MLYHRHFTAVKCLYYKLIHLLKVTGKLFDQLKRKSYLSSFEDIARHATYVNALFTTSQVLSGDSEQLLSYKLLSRTNKV